MLVKNDEDNLKTPALAHLKNDSDQKNKNMGP